MIVENRKKLDARQSPTLSRPAAPLAIGVTKISSVDKTNRNWLPWQRLLYHRKTIFRLIIYSQSSSNPKNLANVGRVDFIGLTEIVKINK